MGLNFNDPAINISQKGDTMNYNPNTRTEENSADYCRRKGWAPGTKITGNEGYGPTVEKITAIGEETVLTKTLHKDGSCSSEHIWTHTCRKWEKIN